MLPLVNTSKARDYAAAIVRSIPPKPQSAPARKGIPNLLSLAYDGAVSQRTSMIVCPNCNHQNPKGAVQCEACYTPLPALAECPNCGESVQSDASFCGQCGFNLKTAVAAIAPPAAPPNHADLLPPDPLLVPDPIGPGLGAPTAAPPEPTPVAVVDQPAAIAPPPVEPAPAIVPPSPPEPAPPGETDTRTKIQQRIVSLLHVQTNTTVELPQKLSVIHIGKPNDRIPPDIDVSGFPNSEIVSRIHVDIRVEGDAYFIEDVGSSNGTYINNLPLAMGNRHRLRSGDRIALGKGDKVTFIFQLSSV